MGDSGPRKVFSSQESSVWRRWNIDTDLVYCSWWFLLFILLYYTPLLSCDCIFFRDITIFFLLFTLIRQKNMQEISVRVNLNTMIYVTSSSSSSFIWPNSLVYFRAIPPRGRSMTHSLPSLYIHEAGKMSWGTHTHAHIHTRVRTTPKFSGLIKSDTHAVVEQLQSAQSVHNRGNPDSSSRPGDNNMGMSPFTL